MFAILLTLLASTAWYWFTARIGEPVPAIALCLRAWRTLFLLQLLGAAIHPPPSVTAELSTGTASQSTSAPSGAIEAAERKYGMRVVYEDAILYGTIDSGVVVNLAQGFSVEVPQGKYGQRSLPPNPDGGFFISLSDKQEASVEVAAHSNCTYTQNSLKEAAEEEVQALGRSMGGRRLIKRVPTRLGSMPAIRLFVLGTSALGHTYIIEMVVAIRGSIKHGNHHSGIVYAPTLYTTPQRYAEDEKVFARLLASWKTLPSNRLESL